MSLNRASLVRRLLHLIAALRTGVCRRVDQSRLRDESPVTKLIVVGFEDLVLQPKHIIAGSAGESVGGIVNSAIQVVVAITAAQ